MRAVIDSCVGAASVLNEPNTAKAKALIEGYRQGIHELIAPDTFVAEVAHVLTKAERNKVIKAGEADTLFAEVLSVPPHLVGYLSLVPRAFEISIQAKIPFYDCVFVALAEKEKIDLITADQKLINTLQLKYVRHVSTLP